MPYFTLVEHKGANMESRFYVNGTRVLEHDFAMLENAAHTHTEAYLGEQATSGRAKPDGRIRRTNTRTIRLPAHILRGLPLVRFNP